MAMDDVFLLAIARDTAHRLQPMRRTGWRHGVTYQVLFACPLRHALVGRNPAPGASALFCVSSTLPHQWHWHAVACPARLVDDRRRISDGRICNISDRVRSRD